MVGFDFEDELVVMLAELRDGLADYLATRPGDGPRTLADVVAFNREHADVELAHFGQALFERSLDGAGRRQRGVRRGAGPLPERGPRDDGIDAVLREHRPRRADHAVVRAGVPDRPGQPGGAQPVVHEPARDGRLPAAHRADRAGRRAAGRRVVLGHGRQRGVPGRDRARATRSPATGTPARSRGRPSSRSSEGTGRAGSAVHGSQDAPRQRSATRKMRRVSGSGRHGW